MNDYAGENPTTTESEGRALLDKLDELLDLATTRCIEEIDGNMVVESLDDAYINLAETGYMGYHDAGELRRHLEPYVQSNGDGSYNPYPPSDPTDTDTDYLSGTTWYINQGPAWREVRSQFEDLVPLFEQINSHRPDNFAYPLAAMRQIRDDLTPVQDLEDRVDELLTIDIDVNPETNNPIAISPDGDRWAAMKGVHEAIYNWRGDAAMIFKGTYTSRFPSILTGQMLVASILVQALEMLDASFRELRNESTILVSDTIDMVEISAYAETTSDVDWATILNTIAGAGTIVAAISAPFPGVGNGIAVAAGIISGGATLLATYLNEDEEFAESKASPVPLEGNTIVEVMDSFRKRTIRYLDVVHGIETFLSEQLPLWQDYFTDRNAPGITIPLIWSNDVELSQWNSFFQPKRPAIADVSDSTNVSDFSSHHMLGDPPREGASFAADLEMLLKAGEQHLPEIAGNYSGLVGRGVTDDLPSAFSRQTSSGESKGAAFQPWMNLYGAFEDMLTGTGENLALAADALVSAANTFAANDVEAAESLAKDSNFYQP